MSGRATAAAPVLTFKTAMPVGETMHFEDVYEVELRMGRSFKEIVLREGIALWMFADGVLAGETYGVSPSKMGADPDDPSAHDPSVMWCWSTTVLPGFQGRGLCKILCAYWLGLVRAAGFRTIKGQATTPRMVAVKASFGARFTEIETNYAGTTRTAHSYSLEL